MKIRLRRTFIYQIDARTTGELGPGEHDVDKALAEKAIRFGGAKLVSEKKAPQNKARGKAPENKARVGKKTKRGGRTGAKPKS